MEPQRDAERVMECKSRRGRLYFRHLPRFAGPVFKPVFKLYRILDFCELDIVRLRRMDEATVVLQDRRNADTRLFRQPGQTHCVRCISQLNARCMDASRLTLL